MPDFGDRVQDAAALFNQQALADAARVSAPMQSRENCLDCEEPIPEERRQAMPGCQRCVDCQSLHENWRPL